MFARNWTRLVRGLARVEAFVLGDIGGVLFWVVRDGLLWGSSCWTTPSPANGLPPSSCWTTPGIDGRYIFELAEPFSR